MKAILNNVGQVMVGSVILFVVTLVYLHVLEALFCPLRTPCQAGTSCQALTPSLARQLFPAISTRREPQIHSLAAISSQARTRCLGQRYFPLGLISFPFTIYPSSFFSFAGSGFLVEPPDFLLVFIFPAGAYFFKSTPLEP